MRQRQERRNSQDRRNEADSIELIDKPSISLPPPLPPTFSCSHAVRCSLPSRHPPLPHLPSRAPQSLSSHMMMASSSSLASWLLLLLVSSSMLLTSLLSVSSVAASHRRALSATTLERWRAGSRSP